MKILAWLLAAVLAGAVAANPPATDAASPFFKGGERIDTNLPPLLKGEERSGLNHPPLAKGGERSEGGLWFVSVDEASGNIIVAREDFDAIVRAHNRQRDEILQL